MECQLVVSLRCATLQQCVGFSPTKTTPLLRSYPRGTTMKYYFPGRALGYTSMIKLRVRGSFRASLFGHRLFTRLWVPTTTLRTS